MRGAHLRAEVYLNRKLVGYSIMEELPFEADLTAAANPGGENLLAIRITNPFGRYDWVDGLNAQWGAVKLYRSHGFGGLDRGMTISSHPKNMRIKDVWILNSPDPRKIYIRAEFDGESSDGALIDLQELQIVDPVSGKMIYTNTINMNPGDASCCDVQIDPKTGKPEKAPTTSGEFPLTCEAAELWALDHPHLYHLK